MAIETCHHIDHAQEHDDRVQQWQQRPQGHRLDGRGIVLHPVNGIRRAPGIVKGKGQALHMAEQARPKIEGELLSHLGMNT